MRTVDALKSYRESYPEYNRDTFAISNNDNSSKLEGIRNSISKIDDLSISGNDRVINSVERQFFINMFPENSSQIENHILFNRNGRLQVQNISKGMIIDGRV